jgi:hypothetical protein
MAKTSNAKSFQVTYKCNKTGDSGFLSTTIGGAGKKMSFECGSCGLTMFPLFPKMELSSHGHTKVTIKHTLLSVREIGVSDGIKAPGNKAQ